MGTIVARSAAVAAAGLLLLVALIAPGAPARSDTVGQITEGLRSSRLYVTTEARGALDAAGQARVRRALEAADRADVRAVVTRAGVDQRTLIGMLRAVQSRLDRGGTYVAITADDRMLAISDRMSGTELNRLIAQTGGGGIEERLVAFSRLAEDQAIESARSGAITTYVMLVLLVLVAAAVTGLMLVSRTRGRRRLARQMAELKDSVQEDVTRLGEDIAALDLRVTDPGLDPAAREDYARALDSYDAAKAAVAAARRPEDMREVTSALEDGRYHMAAVRARLAGEPVPERRPPCFFNPQHGPSARDVVWAPPGGTPREVPACAADAEAVEGGADPDARLVPVGGTRRPYWDAGPLYAPYAGGYYRGFGGVDLLSGMLIGTTLGAVLTPGWGLGAHGDQLGGDAGDLGGGWDFGSGDFGGGFGGDF